MERHPSMTLGVAILFFALSCVTVSHCFAATSQKRNPAEVVMKSCSSCHGIDKVCKKLGSRDRNAWTRTVYGMKQAGARINENDVPILAEYLAGLEPGSKPVCK